MKILALWQNTQLRLAAVLLAGLLEGLGIPVPGSVLLAGIGVAAAADTALLEMTAMAAVFGVGYCMGSLGQYWVGRLLGPSALGRLSQKHQLLVARTMNRFGTAAVLLSRPLAIGNYISLPVGMNRMPLFRFLAYTFLGITPWAFGVMLIARIALELPGMAAFLSTYGLSISLGVVVVCLIPLLWRWLRRKPLPETVAVWPETRVDHCIGD